MRHRVDKVKLNRSGGHRKGLLNNLVRSLFLEGSITTTITKAKWARSRSEHLISIAKKETLDSFRRLIAETGSKEVARKIQETTKELTSRTSGFLRLTKVGIRAGDKSVMVKIEFVKDVKATEAEKKNNKEPSYAKASEGRQTTKNKDSKEDGLVKDEKTPDEVAVRKEETVKE